MCICLSKYHIRICVCVYVYLNVYVCVYVSMYVCVYVFVCVLYHLAVPVSLRPSRAFALAISPYSARTFSLPH